MKFRACLIQNTSITRFHKSEDNTHVYQSIHLQLVSSRILVSSMINSKDVSSNTLQHGRKQLKVLVLASIFCLYLISLQSQCNVLSSSFLRFLVWMTRDWWVSWTCHATYLHLQKLLFFCCLMRARTLFHYELLWSGRWWENICCRLSIINFGKNLLKLFKLISFFNDYKLLNSLIVIIFFWKTHNSKIWRVWKFILSFSLIKRTLFKNILFFYSHKRFVKLVFLD